MKIYFGFTVAGDRSAIDTARRVVELLEECGHEVLTRHLVDANAWEADRLISPQDVYRRDMGWLEQCDLFIAEVSGSSFGLGFETGYLLGATNKKVILLYRREFEQRISLLITGNTHANCTLVPYATMGEVDFARGLPRLIAGLCDLRLHFSADLSDLLFRRSLHRSDGFSAARRFRACAGFRGNRPQRRTYGARKIHENSFFFFLERS